MISFLEKSTGVASVYYNSGTSRYRVTLTSSAEYDEFINIEDF